MSTDTELVEQIARKLAARKMGLVKDPDGTRLPDDLWKQCEDDARAALEASGERDALRKLLGAGTRVLNGLNERIDDATEAEGYVPVFDGIAELSDALHEARAALSPHPEGEREQEGSDNG